MKPVGERNRSFQVADFRKDYDIINRIECTAYEEKYDTYDQRNQKIDSIFFQHKRLFFIKKRTPANINNLKRVFFTAMIRYNSQNIP
jgi:hypothetical protein